MTEKRGTRERQDPVAERNVPFPPGFTDLKKNLNPINSVLLGFTLLGILCKLAVTLSLELNSDTVIPGVISLEFWKYQNHFFTGIFFPSATNFLYSEIIPFHLIPQWLSGYSPLVLKLTAFFIFLCTILVFSLLVFSVTRDRTRALVFSAILANLTPASYLFFGVPAGHCATVLCAGLLLFLLLEPARLNGTRFAIAALLLAAVTFSDNILLLWLFIPFLGYYLLVAEKTRSSNIYVALLAGMCAAVSLAKEFFMPLFTRQEYLFVTDPGSIVFTKIPLLFAGFADLINEYILAIGTGFTVPMAAGMVILAGYIVLLYCVVKKKFPERFGCTDTGTVLDNRVFPGNHRGCLSVHDNKHRPGLLPVPDVSGNPGLRPHRHQLPEGPEGILRSHSGYPRSLRSRKYRVYPE